MVALNLTESGQTQRNILLDCRRAALVEILNVIAPEDRVVLERIVDAMLVTLPGDASSAMTVCRMCNEQSCTDCPMNAFGTIGVGAQAS